VSDCSNFQILHSVRFRVNCLIILYLFRYSERLLLSELHFAFKVNSFINLCSMVSKESMAYYVNHQSSVSCTLLNALKAFDRLKYCKLFKLLISRQVLPLIN